MNHYLYDMYGLKPMQELVIGRVKIPKKCNVIPKNSVVHYNSNDTYITYEDTPVHWWNKIFGFISVKMIHEFY
jgi:hypothetical protein